MKTIFALMLLCLAAFSPALAQNYSLVIKNGHLIDPKNNIDGPMDVAVQDGRIALVARNIDAAQGRQVIDAKGLYVVPGLIDMHAHVFHGMDPDRYLSAGLSALPPDGFTFRVGVTTLVDVGGAGWRNFPLFKKTVIDQAQTRVLALLNIVGEGMRGGAWEQNLSDMDPRLAAAVARQHKTHLVGIKLAHFDGHNWTPTDNAVEAGRLAGIPVMIDFGGAEPPLSLRDLLLEHLRPGDIFTHMYGQVRGRETIVDLETQTVKPFVWEARKRGIIFEVGYGGISFSYSQAIPAMKAGFVPDVISTDLHTGSMNGAMKDQLSVMSKFLQMGMPLSDIIRASTWNPAKTIQREELGHLSTGTEADIAILGLREGDFGFFDYTGYKVRGRQKFECEMTIRAGRIVYDLNGRAEPMVVR
jgi:dihydroorotase